ncbi:MAG TPA: methyltransferase [Thermoanaerobaculia bacterium]|nr:methyltransferase [Thermoanaerobaculia bacterium]
MNGVGITLAILSILIGVLGALRQEVAAAFVAFRNRYFHTNEGVSGFWHTAWDKGDNRPQSEILRLDAFGKTITGSVVFSVDRQSQYHIQGELAESCVISGTWANRNLAYRGFLHATIADSLDYADGYWTGTSLTNKRVKSGTWKMRKITTVPSDLKLRLDFDAFSNALRSVVAQHEARYADGATEYDVAFALNDNQSLQLRLVRGVFDPMLGNISPITAKYLMRLETASALDLGCGSGFLGLYLAKYKGAQVVAVDSSDRAITCTTENALCNGVNGKVTCLRGELYAPVYTACPLPDQFDLIVANLPFTTRHNYDSALSGYNFAERHAPERFRSMFCASPGLLRTVILGAAYFLRLGGRLVIPVGASADLAEVSNAIALSGMPERVGSISTVFGEDIAILDLQKTEAYP